MDVRVYERYVSRWESAMHPIFHIYLKNIQENYRVNTKRITKNEEMGD